MIADSRLLIYSVPILTEHLIRWTHHETNLVTVLHLFSVFSTVTETYHRLRVSTRPDDWNADVAGPRVHSSTRRTDRILAETPLVSGGTARARPTRTTARRGRPPVPGGAASAGRRRRNSRPTAPRRSGGCRPGAVGRRSPRSRAARRPSSPSEAAARRR